MCVFTLFIINYAVLESYFPWLTNIFHIRVNQLCFCNSSVVPRHLVRAFAPQEEGWVFESQPRQT